MMAKAWRQPTVIGCSNGLCGSMMREIAMLADQAWG
jgi:hypothetical protein